MAVLNAKIKLTEANQDPAICGYDDELNPVESETGARITQMEGDREQMVQVVSNLNDQLQKANAPKMLDFGDDGEPSGINGRKFVYGDDGQIKGVE